MIMTLQDLIDNEIELYTIAVAVYRQGDCDKTILSKGEARDCPEELLYRTIGWIYPEHDRGTDQIYTVIEIKEEDV